MEQISKRCTRGVLRLSRRKDLLDRETIEERLRQLQVLWLGRDESFRGWAFHKCLSDFRGQRY